MSQTTSAQGTQTPDWREARRQSARDAIVRAAWELARDEGIAALTLRDLARRAGTTTPTVYSYFDSKNAIYDAMFASAATQFAADMTRPYASQDIRVALTESLRRFIRFCTADVPRYQLLFQRTIPGFEPSAASLEPAEQALGQVRQILAPGGITSQRHIDLWTALTTGLIDQQISNDPGGQRWSRLASESVAMYLSHCQPHPADAEEKNLVSSRRKEAGP